MLIPLILTPFIAAALMPILSKIFKDHVGWVASIVTISLFLAFISMISEVHENGSETGGITWIPSLGINLTAAVDGLSLLIVLLITGIGSADMIYSIFYLHHHERLANFYTFIMIFMGAMLGVCTSTNLIALYLFWELTSISSFLLIGFWYEKENPRYGAQKAMLITVAGGFGILIAFLLMGNIIGSYDIPTLIANADVIKSHALYPAIVLCTLLGAFTKSAQVPFHIWLPTAMEAPTPISCYLHSATMVKAGIYLIARMTPIIGGTALWGGIIAIVGCSSLMFGSFMAIRQYDMKGILAYSTISQLGLIVCLLGLGTEAAIAAAMFHLFNHSAFKGSLFLMTGIVDHQTGTRDVHLLRGLAKVMPICAFVCAIGSFSMAGLPPFSGFLSKELFLESVADAPVNNLAFLGDAAYIIPFVAVVASIFTFVYSIAFFAKIFLGETTTQTPKAPKEAGFGMTLPALTLVSMNILVALFPGFFAETLIDGAASTITQTSIHMHISFWHGITPAFLMTCVIVAIGAIIYMRYDMVKALFLSYSSPIGANKFYDSFLHGLPVYAKKLTDIQLTGRLHDYIGITFVATMVFVYAAMFRANAWSAINLDGMAQVDVLEITLAIIAAVSAVCIAFFKRRIWSVLALSAVGYTVSFYFIVMRAPDLALTQLLVETISTILFLLALYKLPFGMIPYDPPTPNLRRTVNGLIGVAFGFLAFSITMIAQSNKLYPSISSYYSQYAETMGGGTNIVNVILVDFRGFDTMGEICVLGIAAMGVYVMIKLGRNNLFDKYGTQPEKADTFNDTGINSVVIEVDPYFQEEDDLIPPYSPL